MRSLRHKSSQLLLAATFVCLTAACSSPTDKANKYFEKGVALMKEGDMVKAKIELQNALQIKQDLTGAWYALAQIAEQQGDWQKMYGLLGKVIDHDPKHLDAQIKLGRLLLASGQLDKALAASDATVILAPESDDVLALRASVLYKLDDKTGALTHANAALAKNPNNVDALVVLASERLAAKDANKAIEYLDRGLKLNEKNIALQLIKVQALESISKMDSAEEIFRRLVVLYPETRALRHILAQFYLAHDRKDAAEAEYRAIATENPTDMTAQIDVARFVGSTKGIKAAMQELEAMIAKNPDKNELKFALAGIEQSQGEYKAAESVFSVHR
jgi:cellulose synthase operon protein C